MGAKLDLIEEQYDVGAVKAWLVEYRNNERDLDNQNERLERLVMKMTSVGAPVLSDAPKSPNSSRDRFGDYLAKKEELEADIADALQKQKSTRKEIERILKHIRNPDERAVIRMRYLDVSNWTDVTDLMFGGREDYLGKEESYLRRVHKVHGDALRHMAIYIARSQKSS